MTRLDNKRIVSGYLRMAGFTQNDIAKWLKISRPVVNFCISRDAFTEEEKKIIYKNIKDRIPMLTYEELWH